MEKSRFWTLIWACVPGAGEMYMGLMKKGVVIATAFWGAFALMATLQFNVLSFLLPVLWFYSFFDSINLRSVSHDIRIAADDKFSDDFLKFMDGKWKLTFGKRHLLIGGVCILIGIQMVMSNFVSPILWDLELIPWVSRLIHRLPTLLLSIVIILFGVYLIKGKKVYDDEDKELVEYKGDENEQ